MPTFTLKSPIPVPVKELYAYHARPGAIDRLLPRWMNAQILKRGEIRDGAQSVLKVPGGPVRRIWIAEHHDCVENREFSDRALRGPFKAWDHHHRFHNDFAESSILEDTVEYSLPWYAAPFAGRIRRQLARIFRSRHIRTLHDLERHEQFRDQPRQTIAISGATGLVASALAPFLTTAGHRVVPVARSAKIHYPADPPIKWNPATGELAHYRPVDTFIHLAGRNIAVRWSAKVKSEIFNSRVHATENLCRTLAALPSSERPKLLIAASAIGFYGDRGDETLTEYSSPPSDGTSTKPESSISPPARDPRANFMSEVCRQWESATERAEDAGIRVIHLRIGVVLTPKGGALAKLMTPTKLCLSGPLGKGSQWLPWIALDDLVGLIHHIAMTAHTADLSGAINAVSPNPVRQRDFARTLATILHRPAVFPMPAFVVKTLFGQMGKEALLASLRVVPTRTPKDFSYLYPTLESALRAEMGLS